MHEASRKLLKGAVSAQKALQGSETETRELLVGAEQNSIFSTGVIDLPTRKINSYYVYLALLKFYCLGKKWCYVGRSRYVVHLQISALLVRISKS